MLDRPPGGLLSCAIDCTRRRYVPSALTTIANRMGIKGSAVLLGNKCRGGTEQRLQSFENKILGIDASIYLHGGFSDAKSTIAVMSSVNPNTSVLQESSKRHQAWFINQCLYNARAIVMVFDPHLIDKWHCEGCKKAYRDDMAVKYEVSGRNANKSKHEVNKQNYEKALEN